MTAISTSDLVQSAILITAAAVLLTYGVGMKVAGVGVGFFAASTAFLPILITPFFTAALIVLSDYGLISRSNVFLSAALFNSSLVLVGIALGIIFSIQTTSIVFLAVSGVAITAFLLIPSSLSA